MEARPKQNGRVVLMRRGRDHEHTCLTPMPFNIRTRVHEYGGRCHVLGNDSVYFSNFADQRLYVQALTPDTRPVPLTPQRLADGSLGMYADLRLAPDGGKLVFVWESEYEQQQNVNRLGGLDISTGTASEPRVLVEGSDFYASPTVSVDGRLLAWIQWNHPYMPWDRSELWLADLQGEDDGLRVTNPRRIAGGEERSVCQPTFGDDGTLYFVMDYGDDEEQIQQFWNVHKHQDGKVVRLTSDTAEYGYPHWVFGESRYVPMGERHLLAVRTRDQGDNLVLVDTSSGSTSRLDTPYQGLTQLCRANRSDDVLMIAKSTTQGATLVRYRGSNQSLDTLKAPEPMLSTDDISVAQPICYPTRDGAAAYAYFYLPNNARFGGPHKARPPLMVMVHGGPTSRCSHTLDLAKQYWTTMGFAVLDVNHRGSTGHGRAYRQSLLGHWGEFDVIDIVDGIDYLAERDSIDRRKVCIRGRSAGGYTVLRALTRFPDYFSAGSCYFGIGNLVTLTETTHKFELHYVDGLLGEEFDPEQARRSDSLYYQRSPIHYLDRIRSPMIVFQGLQDKVVPPSLSRELVSVLTEQNVDHEYVEYPKEGHGFRSSDTNIDALTREVRFFVRVLGLHRES